ncbi:MAG: right-handed parallel beta-helix repeat-containing protein, partial [Spirochaetes bacterium]|nr:right-handed parallel beta-helix repeat-containing protein [Spirochaetota bacterium]
MLKKLTILASLGAGLLSAWTFDFEAVGAPGTKILNEKWARRSVEGPLAGSASMRIDTRESKETWNPCFAVGGGLLKPDTEYTASFQCRLIETQGDSFVHIIVRPLDVGDASMDVARINLTDSGPAVRTRLRFRTKPADRAWAIQVHTHSRVLAVLDDFRIEEGTGERFVAATPGASPSARPLAVATGCPDFTIELPRPAAKTASVADFGAKASLADNTEAFLAAIAHCASNRVGRLVVPRGVYRFTNNAPIRFEGLSDFEFDGQGSEFIWLKEKNTLMQVARCERVLFRNFFIDWDWDRDPLGSILRVEAVAPDGAYLDAVFPDLARFPKREMRVAILEGLDPATLSVGFENGFNFGFEFYKGRADTPPAKYDWLGDNRVRLYAKDPGQRARFTNEVLSAVKKGPREAGALFRVRHYVYDMVGLHLSDNTNLTLSNVTVYSAPSHAFLSSGEQHHWQFLNTHIIRRPGTKRPLTCSADHHHIAQSLGYFKMIGCEFSLGGDDCLNVHDTSGFASKTGPKTLTTKNMDPGSYRPGDPIELRQDDYSPTGLTATYRARKGEWKGRKGTYELEFDEALPEQKGRGFILFNRRFGSRNILIRDCFFHDNKARGLLLLADHVTVEGCRFFHNEMGAIKIETGYTFDVWSEGYGASNIVIRSNTFQNVNPIGAYPNERQPVIYMSVYLKTDPSSEKTPFPILNTILIERNL